MARALPHAPRLPWFALMLLLVGACASAKKPPRFDTDDGGTKPMDAAGGDPDGGPGPAALTFAEFQKAIPDHYCFRADRCSDLGALTFGACRSLVANSFDSSFGRFGEAIEAGQLGFNGAQAAACLTDIELQPCKENPLAGFGNFDGNVGPCGQLFEAKVEPGGRCSGLSTWVVCKGGYCGDMPGFSSACDEVCHAYQEIDQACGVGQYCDPAVAYCGTNSLCKPRGGDGDACTLEADCQTGYTCVMGDHCEPDGTHLLNDECSTSYNCNAGLVCVGGKCANPLPFDAPCAEDEAGCAWPMRCIAGHCGTPKGPNETCPNAEEGTVFACENSVCYEGVCRPLVGSGDACLVDGQCPRGLICAGAGASRVCSARKAADAACEFDTECKAGLSCILGVCTATPTDVNDKCQGVCPGELYCNQSMQRCKARDPVGTACASDATCASHACEVDACTAACTF